MHGAQGLRDVGDSIVLMGKNTMMKRSIRLYCERTGNETWSNLLDSLVGLSPGFLQPAESLIGNDVVSLLRLQVSPDSVLRLGVGLGFSVSDCAPVAPTAMAHPQAPTR